MIVFIPPFGTNPFQYSSANQNIFQFSVQLVPTYLIYQVDSMQTVRHDHPCESHRGTRKRPDRIRLRASVSLDDACASKAQKPT